MHERTRRSTAAAALVGIAAIALSACSAGGGEAGNDGSGTSGGSITVALDQSLAGFNINTAAASGFAAQEILDTVWPQPFIVDPALKPQLNTQLISSVRVTDSPQTVTYDISHKARWSDGTPIDADDFIYNWQAQSGNPAFTDLGNQPYDAASTTGYSQIASVTGSHPPGGTCASGSVADRNAGLCPNGDTVTVTFATPYADWRSLFANLVPAHVARIVGWNTGFTVASQTISGSWYEIENYDVGRSVVLVRNPRYWGTPGRLDKIVFRFFPDDAAEVAALRDNEVQVINPTSVSTSVVHSADQVPATDTVTVPGLEFEHLDFNEADPYLAELQVRQAIALGTDRRQIISRTVGQIAPGLEPLGNRMFVSTQPQYVDNGKAYGEVDDSHAESLLSGLGFTRAPDGYYQPDFGPEKGQDLTFTVQSTSGDPIRLETEQLFRAQMKAIGIKIDIQNYEAATFFGTNLPDGAYQIAEFAWLDTPFPSGNQSLYCSYTDTRQCGQNWIHYADPRVDLLMAEGSTASTAAVEAADFNAADKILWSDMATLPLYEYPQFFAWSTSYDHVVPNTSVPGIAWDANLWSLGAS